MDRSIVTVFEPSLPDGVRFEDHGHRVRLVAERELDGQASGRFARPAIGADFAARRPAAGTAYVGYSFAQFAMPVTAGPDRPFDWNPAANVHSPPAVIPLLVRSADGTVALLAPLDGWHEQIIAVDQDDSGVIGFRWGWHGDLDRIPAGTTATLGIYESADPTGAFARWRADLAGSRPGWPPRRPDDPVTRTLSYWTDNGAAYWYRTEPGRDMATTLVDKVDELDRLGLPIGSIELDSWFYPHEVSRPVVEIGPGPTAGDPPTEVPPTGMTEWSPRPDVLPDGVADLWRRLGRRPLVLHARHIAASSTYLEGAEPGAWWIDLGAHPTDPAFFERWAADAAAWGATCIEQDWMLMTWFGNGPLRAEPGRALAWQRGLDRAAAAYGLTLLWCMATPGDLLATIDLERVCAVRTCDDYRYAEDPARLWRWYLTVNRLARALDLPVSKDCFFTGTEARPTEFDGDPNAEVEAVLAGLSGGVVGIGDRIGRTDPALVARLCRPDGVLVQPDVPLAVADRSLFETAADPVPTWAETWIGPLGPEGTTGSWRYVVALHAAATTDPVRGVFELDEPVLVYDWRRGTAEVAGAIDVTLARRDWALFVCCPLPADEADRTEPIPIGDPTKLATMGRTRIGWGDDGSIRPILAEGETGVTVRFWTVADGIVDRRLP